ncbi:MAG: ABC transporter permease [Chloroflexota bacterium]|nr:ABC transporter permease [Chloroflexota bacterium]
MATQALSYPTRPAPRRTSFWATLASEWAKLTSLRSFYISALMTLVLAIGLSGGVSLIIASTWSDWGPIERASFDPILMSLFGLVFSSILLTLIAVSFVASEYATGMIRLTLTATPRRGRVLLAKAIIITGVSVVLGYISVIAAFLLGQAIFSANGLGSATLGDSDAMRAMIGLGLTAAAFPLIGAALAVLFRSTAAAISTVLALIFTPAIFGAMLPAWWQENVLRYLPDRAIDSITIGHLFTGVSGMTFGEYLDLGAGIAVTVAWLVLFLGAATIVLLRRDV